MTLQAGAARVDITPPAGLPLAGCPHIHQFPGSPAEMSAYRGRDGTPAGVALGVHDPLYARALVLADGAECLAICTADLCAPDHDLTGRIRQAVQAQTGIAAANVVVHASHTHGGPDWSSLWSEYPAARLDAIVDGMVGAVAAAAAQQQPAAVGFGSGGLAGVGTNRVDRSGPVDPEVGVLKVSGASGLIACIVGHALHTNLLGQECRLYTADWSGYLCNTLEAIYPGAVALFLQGAAGDINPAHYPVSRENLPTADRRLRAAGQPTIRTFDMAARIGRTLAAEALRVLEVTPVADGGLRSGRRRVMLPVKQGEAMAQFCDYMALLPAWRERFEHLQWLESEVQAMRIGPVTYLLLPGEPYTATALRLKAAGGVQVAGYCNDDVLYIPPDTHWDRPRYENVGTPLAPGAETALLEAARALLQSLSD